VGFLASADPEVRSSGTVNGTHIYSSVRPVMSRPSAKTEIVTMSTQLFYSYNVSAPQTHRCVKCVGMTTQTKVTSRPTSKRRTNKGKIYLLSFGCVHIKPKATAML